MGAKSPQLRIGTSGWIYRHWKNIFYPSGLAQKKWFEFYSQKFDTVEVNFTFYRLPAKSVFESWNVQAPEEFCFALKGSQYVTHMKRLLDPHEHVGLFFDHAKPLLPHTGPILWQLPPSFSRDDGRLADFLDALPSGYRHTMEFRHPSWFVDEVFACLRRHDVALCLADSRKKPAHIQLTAAWTYIRFHEGANGGDYSHEQLKQWAERIQGYLDQKIDVWAFFNNDPHGYAVKNALDLLVNPVGVSKWSGIEAYCALHDIAPDEVAAVGDGLNNLDMLRRAAVRIGVRGGREEVAAIADFMIEPPERGGWEKTVEILAGLA